MAEPRTYTPAPWTFNKMTLEIEGSVDGRECVIAEVLDSAEFEGFAYYDGPMIAAAPELLEALKEACLNKCFCLITDEGVKCWACKGRDAIKKAEER